MGLKRKKVGDKPSTKKEPNARMQEAYEKHRQELAARGVVMLNDVMPFDPAANKFGPKDRKTVEVVVQMWLSRGYTVSRACQEAGISMPTLVNWRRDSEEFDKKIKTAIEIGTDYIEDEMRRRAVDGVDRPVFQQGECVGFIREYSDSLLQAIVGGRRPHIYGKQRLEMSGPDGGAIKYETEVTFVKPKGS